VLVDAEKNKVSGALDLRLASAHRVEFGYVLARPCWGQGLMTEALTEVVAWVLTQPPIFRISAVCDVENIGSARVMEKAGLTREGLLRRWLVHPNIGGDPRDCFSYARVR
jgi:RimJ/RimL family protein N-acetyltransferase